MTKPKLGVFIGRLQPMHEGHELIIQTMIDNTDKQLVLIGSANQSNTLKNPWSYAERRDNVKQKFPNVSVEPLNDYLYNDFKWLDQTQYIIRMYSEDHDVCLYGHTKPDNLYLSWFQSYEYIEVDPVSTISGTQIRTELAENNQLPELAQEDYNYFKNEKQMFANYPFPETLTFCCSDALVITDDEQVLLIKRKTAPGRNKWAMPGGFKNANETFDQCADRELLEETGLFINSKTHKTQLFDSVRRDSGGILRVTYCKMFVVDEPMQPVANDDAIDAQWFPLSTVLNDLDMFHDHRDIISSMTNTFAKIKFNSK